MGLWEVNPIYIYIYIYIIRYAFSQTFAHFFGVICVYLST